MEKKGEKEVILDVTPKEWMDFTSIHYESISKPSSVGTYEYYPLFRNLRLRAKSKLKNLRLDSYPAVGGDDFKKIARLIGFYNALWLRSKLNS